MKNKIFIVVLFVFICVINFNYTSSFEVKESCIDNLCSRIINDFDNNSTLKILYESNWSLNENNNIDMFFYKDNISSELGDIVFLFNNYSVDYYFLSRKDMGFYRSIIRVNNSNLNVFNFVIKYCYGDIISCSGDVIPLENFTINIEKKFFSEVDKNTFVTRNSLYFSNWFDKYYKHIIWIFVGLIIISILAYLIPKRT